jgi:hypothetical protein
MTAAFEYRRDGWPLCPQCGEDELMSLVPYSISLFPKATDRMRCLVCRWEGFVPAREEPAADE